MRGLIALSALCCLLLWQPTVSGGESVEAKIWASSKSKEEIMEKIRQIGLKDAKRREEDMNIMAASMKIDEESKNGTLFGDMLVAAPDAPEGVLRGGICKQCTMWPKGKDGRYYVPYKISSDFSQEEVEEFILWSMKLIEINSNVRFVEWTTEKSYLDIKDGSGCWSFVGDLKRGPQTLSLRRPGCVFKPTVIHELFHALGLGHEHQRPDRDQYINVYLQNVQSSFGDALTIRTNIDDGKKSPYDFASIMHYTSNAFSRSWNLKTIVPKDASMTQKIDARTMPSTCDWREIGLMYPGPTAAPECVPHRLETVCSIAQNCAEVYTAEFCEAQCQYACEQYTSPNFENMCYMPKYKDLLHKAAPSAAAHALPSAILLLTSAVAVSLAL